MSRSLPNDTGSIHRTGRSGSGQVGHAFRALHRYRLQQHGYVAVSRRSEIPSSFRNHGTGRSRIRRQLHPRASLVSQFPYRCIPETHRRSDWGDGGSLRISVALGPAGVSFTDHVETHCAGYPGIAFAVWRDSALRRLQLMITPRATSRCGTSVARRPGIRGSHSLIFGANYRRWKLKRDLAAGFSR